MDIAQIKFDHNNVYQMRLEGALNSPVIDWCGDISIIPHENDDTLLISLTIDAHSLRGFLDQFQDLSLTVLPTERFEEETSR